jgi:hypothetical protein
VNSITALGKPPSVLDEYTSKGHVRLKSGKTIIGEVFVSSTYAQEICGDSEMETLVAQADNKHYVRKMALGPQATVCVSGRKVPVAKIIVSDAGKKRAQAEYVVRV